MADNVKYSEPTSGTVIASDDLGGGVQIQRMKPASGTDGIALDVHAGNPMPVACGISAEVAGLARFFDGNVTATAKAIKTTAGRLRALHVANKNPRTCFLQFFDASVGSVNVGTTAPVFSVAVPPGDNDTVYGQVELDLGGPVEFATAISVAATTTPTGGAGPATGLVVNGWYK